MSNKNHIAYGVAAALIQFVLSLGFYFAKLNQEKWTGYVSLAVLVVAVILSCQDYGKKNPGQTFGSIFANGFKTTAVITVIGILLSIVFLAIFPDVKEQAMEAARKQMEADHRLTEDQIDTALELTKKMFYPLVIGVALFGNLIAGLIASLIGAGIAPKGQQGRPQ